MSSLLIKYGAEVDVSVDGKTLLNIHLDESVLEDKIDPQIISYFIAEGVDPNSAVRTKKTSSELLQKITNAVQEGLFQRKCVIGNVLQSHLNPPGLVRLVCDYV